MLQKDQYFTNKNSKPKLSKRDAVSHLIINVNVNQRHYK